MGMFDSFYDADGIEWQTKALDCTLARYNIGDPVPGPPLTYQIEVLGGPFSHNAADYRYSFATIRDGALASLPDTRDASLPSVDYGGSWDTKEG